jgi:hypothetical protein
MLSKGDHKARFGPRNGDPSHPRHPKYEKTAKSLYHQRIFTSLIKKLHGFVALLPIHFMCVRSSNHIAHDAVKFN